VTPAGTATAPSVGLVFFRRGRKFAEAGPFPGRLEKSSEQKASYFAQIPLEKFPRGRYTLQVNVLDPAIERVAFARLPMPSFRHPAEPAGGNGK